jgi:O-antigen ligase
MLTTTAAPTVAAPRVPTPAVGVGTIWTLLLINTLAFTGAATLFPFPHAVGQLITMGSLGLAFLLVVMRNRRLLIRPGLVLSLFTVLALAALASSLRMEAGVGALLRSARSFLFLGTLWLLSAWWQHALVFVRRHIQAVLAVQALVVLGIVAAPGKALHGSENRLVGMIWPMPAPQVGQLAAVAVGLLLTLWVGRQVPGRSVAFLAPALVVLLLLTHTRTALAGLLIGLLVALASQVLVSPRAARFLLTVLAVAGSAAALLGPFLMRWLSRGQDATQLSSLTGRQNVWSALLAQPRSLGDRVFGIGLSDKSFGGLPIDSTWLATYYEQGLLGVCLVAAIFLALVLSVIAAPPSPGRACALFLVTYLLVASYTEVGIGDAGTYQLYAVLAAALVSHGSWTRVREGVS